VTTTPLPIPLLLLRMRSQSQQLEARTGSSQRLFEEAAAQYEKTQHALAEFEKEKVDVQLSSK
jgi:hypothetical protein